MGASLYSVKVAELSGTDVTLQLEIIHPDAGLHVNDEYTPAFALRLLYDTAYELDMDGDDPFASKGSCALGNAFSYNDSTSEEWVTEHAAEYIASATVESPEFTDLPPVGMKALLKIKATDPKWLEHLKPGQVWESAAY